MPLLTDKNATNCYDVSYFDTDAVEERRNWTAVFSYDLLPCKSSGKWHSMQGRKSGGGDRG